MKIKLRGDYKSIAEEIHGVEPTTATDVNDLDASTEYVVLFVSFIQGYAIAYIDLGAPWAQGFDLRLFEIIDPSLPSEWRIAYGRATYSTQHTALLGPDFWVADHHWYELLLDNDPVACTEYAEYLRAVSRR